MNQPLYAPLPFSVEFEGRKYKLKPYYDNVLESFTVFRDTGLSDYDKVSYCVWLLVQGRHPVSGELLNAVYDTLIEKQKTGSDGPKSFDFNQDAAYIYAGFKQAYGIDLYSERGKLHWWKFIALFGGLPENTRIREIMSIRTREIPAATKYNGQEIAQLVKLKQQYALIITEEERAEQFQKGLQKIAKGIMSIGQGG